MNNPDQPAIYDHFQRAEDDKRNRMLRRDKLSIRLIHKAVDMADVDDMGDTNIRTGMGWKELAVVGSLMAGTLCGSYLLNRPIAPAPLIPVIPVVQPATPPPNVDADTKYDLKFVEPK